MSIPNDNRAYATLNERFATANTLNAARTLLFWGSQTFMPKG